MKTLTEQDFCRAAKRLRCEVAAIQAVAKVESAGNGFYSDGFPVLLYERHLFRKFTGGKYNNYPELSGSQGNYGAAGANQRRKFSAAFALDPDAAMKSCSWGKFQILGSNHKICGYSTVGKFVDAMKESEGKQLDAFVEFVIGNNLDGHLRTRNWAKFAKGYNGPKYAQNQYDIKMAKAYSTFAKKPIDCNSVASNVSTDTQSVASTDNHSPEPSPEPQAPPTNTVVVEKEEQVGFFKGIWKELTGWTVFQGGLQTLQQYKEQVDALGLPGWLIIYTIVGTFAIFVIWLIYRGVHHLLEKWQKRSLTNSLVVANATPSNTVIVATSDKLAELEAQGYVVVRRQ